MNYLLIHPGEKGILTDAGDRPPMGLLYLSAALKSKGIEHKVLDMNHTDEKKVLEEVKNYDNIGISLFTSAVYDKVKDLANKIHHINGKKRKVIVGGYHVTADPDSVMSFADEAITEYGERQILGHSGFDINEFPIPNREALDMTNYNMFMEGNRTTLMTTSRGCPFTCSFCGNFDHKTKYRHIDNIVKEMDEIKDLEYQGIYFTDDSFTMNMNHASKVMQQAKSRGLEYRIATRSQFINEDIAKHLKETGCTMVGLGIESGNNQILKGANKQMTKEQNEQAVYTLNKAGIKTKGFFIIGLPHETKETARETIKFAKHLRLKGLNSADFYPMTPFPGSDINKHPEKYGLTILTKDYSKYIQAGTKTPDPIIRTEYLGPHEIKELLEEAQAEWH